MNESEENCRYVSSRGLLKSCDVHSTTPLSSIDCLVDYNVSFLKDIKENATVYVCNTAISFFSGIINDIQNKFILVSGDSDTSVPTEIFSNNADFDRFINNEHLIHWFAQNCVVQHPKITHLPIGMDYHTISSIPHSWGNNKDHAWGDNMTPVEQEKQLDAIKKSSPEFWNRKKKCYSNFHFNMNTKFAYDRKDAKELIEPELVFYQPEMVSRVESWRTQSEYAFVLSPHGGGLDCHRTWEALCLGCIVIVKTSPLDPLYSGLPILIVSDWSDISEDLLEETITRFKNRVFNHDKLTLSYWVNEIRSKAGIPSQPYIQTTFEQTMKETTKEMVIERPDNSTVETIEPVSIKEKYRGYNFVDSLSVTI